MNRSILILAAIILWASSPTTATLYDHTYYVAPSDSMCTNDTYPCQELDKYLINASTYFQSQTQFIFLPGVHIFQLGNLLEVQNILNICLVGSGDFTQHSVAENVSEYGFDHYNDDQYITYLQSTTVILCTNPSGLSFFNVTNLTLANLTLLNCGQYSPLTLQNASIHIANVYSLLMEGVSVLNSTGFGLYGCNIFGHSKITNSSFVGNNQYVKDLLQPMSIKNCKNETGNLYTNDGIYTNIYYRGGNIYLYYDDSNLIANDELEISFILVAMGMDTCFFDGDEDYYHNVNYCYVPGTGLSLEMDQSLYSMNITIDDLVAYRNQGVDGANIYINVANSTSYVMLSNINSSYATSYYSAVTTLSLFSLKDSMFQCSFASFGDPALLDLQTSSNPFPSEIENCTFIGQGGSGSDIASTGTINIKDCAFYGTNISLNQSSIENITLMQSIVCFDSATIHLAGNNTFVLSTMEVMNMSEVYFAGNSTFVRSTMEVMNMSEVRFTGNYTFVQSTMNAINSIVWFQKGYNTLLQSTVRFNSAFIVLAANNTFVLSTMEVMNTSKVLLINNTFVQSTVVVNNAMVYLRGINMFSNNFISNNGAGLLLLNNAELLFEPNSTTTFTNNTALSGGAIYIDSTSTVMFYSPTNVKFINNTALLEGGAIYAEKPSNNVCFFAPICPYYEGIHLHFENNFANNGGSVLFGGDIDTCSLDASCMSTSTAVFDAITIIGYHDPSTSLISSDSLCISSCNTSACLSFQNISIYPGQVPQLTFITVGQRNGIVPSEIYVRSNTRIIGIINTLKQCSSYPIPYGFYNGTEELVTAAALLSDSNFLFNSLSVHITVLPCPVFFVQNSSTSPYACVCDPLLTRHNLKCSINDATVINTGNIWIGLSSQGVQSFYSPCPFDYCTQNETINVLDLDSQCSYSRSGVLCGGCQANLSMMFGTSQCARCSNYYLLLIIVFIIMGVVLVVMVIASNFTVSNGALNGIVLYVNLIRINNGIYFQSRGVYSYILSIMVAWLNLDFGIEVCFYNGMDSYVKTWLQFVFPIYVFSLVGGVILAGRYSSWISKLNAVPVLSTLVLLSYSKILRTIINIFAYASLDTMNSSSSVWLYDGNVTYLGIEENKNHLILFLCGLVITSVFIFPYLALLLLAPCTQTRSHWRCLRWINNLKPIFDSYQAPFKDRYRFWPGVLLFIRLPMYLVFILSDSTPVKMFTIIFCAIAYLLCAIGFSVYKNWSDFLVESIFIANIVVLSAAVLASSNAISPISERSSEAIIATCITSAMLLLAVIVIHHRLRKISLIRSCVQSWWRRVSTEKSVQLQTLTSQKNVFPISQCREPLLESSH